MTVNKIVLSVFSTLFLITGNAQISALGIQTKVNGARHHYNFPEQPKDGVSATDNLYSFGADIFGDYQLTNKITFRAKVGYETKGFTAFQSFTNSPSPNDGKYKFNYFSTDLVVNYHIFTMNDAVKIYPFAGFSMGYLHNKNVPAPSAGNSVSHYPALTNNFSNYSNFNFGAILGAGINIKNVFWLEAELNKDLVSPLNNANLSARNRVISLNLGVNLLQVYKNIK